MKKPSATPSGTFKIGGDIEVNRLGFGAMRITGKGIWGPPNDRDEAKKLLHEVLDLGINFIDTADSYGPEVSEDLIREALYPYPKELLIATKGGLLRPGPDQWRPNGDPDYLEQALKVSLKRLKLDRIDLYQLHRVDSKIPMAESLGRLVDLQKEGLIRHIGLSEVTTEQLKEAQQYADIVTIQNRFNIADREWDEEVDYCEANQIGFIPWYPLAAGAVNHEGLNQVAAEKGVSIFQLAIAWLLHRSPAILPIPGTSSIPHLHDNVAAAAIQLTEKDMERLDV